MKLTRSSIFTKLIILVLVVYAVVSLINLREKAAQAEEENLQLQQQADALRLENEKLAYEIENSEDEETKIRIAREKLGLASPGEKIFYNTGS